MRDLETGDRVAREPLDSPCEIVSMIDGVFKQVSACTTGVRTDAFMW